MRSRTRTIGTLLILVLPLALWFVYFNALYVGQTLACLSSEPPSPVLRIGALMAAALISITLLAIAVRCNASGVLRRNGIGEIALLSTIGTVLAAVAMLAIPFC